MTPEQLKAMRELIDAAKPFLSSEVVDETSGTIPLIERLTAAIDEAEQAISEKGR